MTVKMTASRDSKLELDEEKCPSLLLSEPNVELKSQNDFGIYQLNLFAITQLGYLPVAGGMLTTTFFEPSKESCINFNPFSYSNASSPEFQSLLMEWNQHCQQSSLTIIISTIVMLGAVVGAFCSGFLADRFGRKPVVVGTMFILSLSHGALTLYAGYFQIYAFVILFTIGCVSGGYMVVNLVLLIESLENSRSRLLAVSLNGWPIGMSGVALVGYWTQNWRSYHIIMSITAAFLALILQLFSRESNRWLSDRGISYDNMQKRNINIRKKISTFCSSPFLKITKRSYTINEVPSSSFLMSDIKVINDPINTEQMSSDSTESSKNVYTYFDLFRYNSVLIPLLALSYSFTSSSIISFGFYFAIEILPGNRYVNLASMGALKLSLGLLPFIFSLWFGRRPIFIISIGIACISCCILVLCETFFNSHWVITVLSLLITASMDPAWKINHLYSTELFPTPVRNMCRAVCNVGARFGSLVAPSIIYLRQQWPFFPYVIFLILLTGQLILGICLFPETRDRPMIEEISERTKEKQLKDDSKTNC